MSVKINELSENDYKLLAYINKFESVSKEQIKQQFHKEIDAIDYHLPVLKQPRYDDLGYGARKVIENSSYIVEEFNMVNSPYGLRPVSKNSFHISGLGKSALQEHEQKAKIDRKDTLLKSVWIPIAVTILTSLILNGLESLYPLIRQWLSYILK